MGGTANAKRSLVRQKMKAEYKKKANAAKDTAANTAQNSAVSARPSAFTTPLPSLHRMDQSTPEISESAAKCRPVSQNILLLDGRELASPYIDGDLFQQEVQVRSNRVRNPMEPLNRIKANISRHIGLSQRGFDSRFDDSSSRGGSDYAPVIRQQFKVTTARKPKTMMGRLLCTINPDDFAYRPSRFATGYINWTFRSGFFIVFLSFVIIFLLLVFIFGLFLAWAGFKNPQCIVVAGDEFGLNDGTELWDGFALSWTTFTTVGYGAVYTATGNNHADQGSCAIIAILCTTESFIGLLYAGICTAIIFGKIGRIQSHAQVTFSDAMCVEYGKMEGAPDTTRSASMVRSFGESDRSLGAYESVDFKEGGETKFVKKLPEQEKHLGMLGIANMTINEESDDDDNDMHYDESIDNTMMKNSNSGHMSMDDLDDAVVQPPQATKSLEPKKILCPVLRFQLVNEVSNERFHSYKGYFEDVFQLIVSLFHHPSLQILPEEKSLMQTLTSWFEKRKRATHMNQLHAFSALNLKNHHIHFSIVYGMAVTNWTGNLPLYQCKREV